MNKRVALQISILWLGLGLSAVFVPKLTAQQPTETPASQVVSPSDDSSASPPEQTGDNGMQESDQSEAEGMLEEAEAPTPAQEAFQRALEHEKNNELDKAIEDCTEAIQLDPANLDYLTTRAELYGEMRNQDKAMEDAAKILEKDLGNLRARLLRGKMFELSGDPQKALVEFNTAVEQNPTSWQALFERQSHFERQGDHDKALADGDRMIQLQPDIAAGYLSRSMSHAAVGEWQQAMQYSSQVIQQNQENWVAYMVRATSRAAQSDNAGAKEDFDVAAKLAPDNAIVLNARGAFYFVMGDYEKSLADLRKAVELQPRQYGFIASLADFLATCPDERLRNGEKAAQYANVALQLAPNAFEVWRACASAAAENGNFEEAVKWEERLLNAKGMSPDRKSETERRLETYKSGKPYRINVPPPDKLLVLDKIKDADQAIKNGNFDRGIALLSEAIATDTKDPVPYFGRGFAYGKEKKYDLAIRDFNTAIDLNPKDAEAYLYRAGLFERTRQNKKALDDLLKAYELDPESGNGMRNNLAWFYATCPDEEVRSADKAADYIDRALELRPNEPAIWDTCAAVFAENGDFDDAVEWERAYLDRKDITEENRRDGEKRLSLYQQNQPYRQHKEDETNQAIVSTTPAQPGK